MERSLVPLGLTEHLPLLEQKKDAAESSLNLTEMLHHEPHS